MRGKSWHLPQDRADGHGVGDHKPMTHAWGLRQFLPGFYHSLFGSIEFSSRRGRTATGVALESGGVPRRARTISDQEGSFQAPKSISRRRGNP